MGKTHSSRIFKGGGSVGASLHIEDVGDDPPHGPGSGGLSAQGVQGNQRYTAIVASIWKLGVTPLEEEMRGAVLEEVYEYVLRMQNTAGQYIATCPILDLCEELVQRPGTWVVERWWYQEGLDTEGLKAVAYAADDGRE